MSNSLRVLMVEDSEDDTLLIIRELKKGAYKLDYQRVETAEAMRTALQEKTWDIILCDYQLPKFNGLASIALRNETDIDIPLIIVSGAIGEETAAECMRLGAHDYIMKNNLSRLNPAIERELKEAESRRQRRQAEQALRESEEKFRYMTENSSDVIWHLDRNNRFDYISPADERMRGFTQQEVLGTHVWSLLKPERIEFVKQEDAQRFSDQQKGINIGTVHYELELLCKDGSWIWAGINVTAHHDQKGELIGLHGVTRNITEQKKSSERTRKTLESIVQAMTITVETRDPYTAGHQRRVADLARAIATEMHLPADQIEGLWMASVIHDLGKIVIPAEILSKPTKLTELEFSLIKTHSQSGYNILKDIEFPWPIARIILEHHERIDGSGYPNGLRGEEILLESRILSVADVVEAMASHRPYRPSLGMEVALEEILKNKGTIYDNAVATSCLKLFREKGFQLTEKLILNDNHRRPSL